MNLSIYICNMKLSLFRTTSSRFSLSTEDSSHEFEVVIYSYLANPQYKRISLLTISGEIISRHPYLLVTMRFFYGYTIHTTINNKNKQFSVGPPRFFYFNCDADHWQNFLKEYHAATCQAANHNNSKCLVSLYRCRL